MKISATEKQEAINSLKTLLSPGQTIYTILRSVSGSGMTRSISCVIVNDGQITSIDWYIQRALGYSRHKSNNGLIVKGAGMDMGFAIVYDLGRTLKLDYNGKDSGYALNHTWL